MKRNEAQILLRLHLRELGFQELEIIDEYRFWQERRWRFDIAIPHKRLAIEIEGGAFVRGRHTRGAGFVGDMEKYNIAQVNGWHILRFTPQQVKKGEAKQFIDTWFRPVAA